MRLSKALHPSLILIVLLATTHTHAQAKQDKPVRLSFDVASIRPSSTDAAGDRLIKPLPGGTGYTVENMPTRLMIGLMYKVPARQITGGPEWLTTQNYNIEARADGAYSLDDLHIMFQNLLADRFNLKFHKETRDGPVYVLSVDPAGLKMKPDGVGQALDIPITFGKDSTAIGTRVPMSYLTWWLGQLLQNDARPVIDRTGLTSSYDFTLAFAQQLPPDATRESQPPELRDRPSLFEALKQQLGLKLEAQRGPVDYYVIDHIDKPSEN
jgi:uncharacterized protein (TIGR03435 family)